jgi:hypothetical protein
MVILTNMRIIVIVHHQVGDILRLGSVGVLVSEINTGNSLQVSQRPSPPLIPHTTTWPPRQPQCMDAK